MISLHMEPKIPKIIHKVYRSFKVFVSIALICPAESILLYLIKKITDDYVFDFGLK